MKGQSYIKSVMGFCGGQGDRMMADRGHMSVHRWLECQAGCGTDWFPLDTYLEKLTQSRCYWTSK